jgi:sugar lactone lactonase YvrE
VRIWPTLAVSCIFAASAWAQNTPQRLATRPSDRIENVFETSDGSLYFTGVLKSEVLVRRPDGRVEVFIDSIKNPQGILPYRAGFVVDSQDQNPNFTDPKGFSFAKLGARLSIVSAHGKILRTLHGPDEDAFYNGMAFAGADTLMIADSGGDRILRIKLVNGTVETWLTDATLRVALGEKGSPNGLKVMGGWLYFSRGDIYKIRIGANGLPEGSPALALQTGGTDDFDVARDGTIYGTSRSGIVAASPGGVSSTVTADAPAATAVRISRNGKALLITGGGFPFMPASPQYGYVIRVELTGK